VILFPVVLPVIVATAVFVDSHVIVLFVAVSGRTVASRVTNPPCSIAAVGGVIATEAACCTGVSETVTAT
jgi:hypothetical protein